MSFFAIKNCEMRGCQHWRIDDKCFKDKKSIGLTIRYVYTTHPPEVCEMRKQVGEYKLKHMLEP
jgi:hypothetical protein